MSSEAGKKLKNTGEEPAQALKVPVQKSRWHGSLGTQRRHRNEAGIRPPSKQFVSVLTETGRFSSYVFLSLVP